jgi:protease I
MIVIVGGSGSPGLANRTEVIDLLNRAEDQGKKMAAICLGPMVLAKAGILQGKKATVFQTKESLAALQQGGATFIDTTLVTDGNVVTANGPAVAQAFGQELVKLMQK